MKYGCVSDSHDYGTTREEMLEILKESHNTCFVFEEIEGQEISVDIIIQPLYGKVPRFSRFPWIWYDWEETGRKFWIYRETGCGKVTYEDPEAALSAAEGVLSRRVQAKRELLELERLEEMSS